MIVSQNGWPADPDPTAIGIAPCTVAGVLIGDGLRAGDVTTVLAYVLVEFDRRVEPLVTGWCWGFNYRPITSGTDLSNHASGTAVDVNAPDHPLGQRGTFTPTQVAEIHRILAEVDNVVRWGGDYAGRVDEMHFEINGTYAAVARVAARLEGHMARALDFSGRPPGAAAIVAAGFRIVLRYIGLGGEGKQIHRAEWQDYLDHGVLVILIAELGINDAWEGTDDFALGVARAQLAMADVRAEAPRSVDPNQVLIGCAADAHASSAAQISDAVKYSRGFSSVIGLWRSGFYGFRETSVAVHDAGAAGWHWRCGSEPTAAEKRWVNFWQRNTAPQAIVLGGTQCDINEVFAPLNLTQEDDMPTVEEIRKAVLDTDLGGGWTLADAARAWTIGKDQVRPAGELTTALAEVRDRPAAAVTLDAAGLKTLATGIVTDLAARGYNNITSTQIEAAVEEGVRAVLARAAQAPGSEAA